MQSLFPVNAGGRGRAVEAPLLSFKAGKCELEPLPNGKFTVRADIRRGQVTIVKGNDGLRHVSEPQHICSSIHIFILLCMGLLSTVLVQME